MLLNKEELVLTQFIVHTISLPALRFVCDPKDCVPVPLLRREGVGVGEELAKLLIESSTLAD